MKKYAIVIFIALAFLTVSFAQTPTQEQKPATQQQNVILKPKVYVEDLVLSWQLLSSIELKANEVDAFLAVKSFLKPYIEKAQKDNLQLSATMDLDAPLATANNLIQFLERSSIPAAQAERYKRFVLSFQEAAKNYKQ